MEGDIVIVPVDLTGRLPNLPKIGPKQLRHPTVGGMCLLCQKIFETGCFTTIVPLGPGIDEAAQKAAREGDKPYAGIGMELHWTCATGEPDVDIEIATKLPPDLGPPSSL